MTNLGDISERFFQKLLLIAALVLTVAVALSQENTVIYLSDRSRKLAPEQLLKDIQRVKLGDMIAAERVGLHYQDSGNFDSALQWLRVASILGNHKAQHDFYICAASVKNLDVPIQIEAVFWLDKSAETYEPARTTKAAAIKFHGCLDHCWKSQGK